MGIKASLCRLGQVVAVVCGGAGDRRHTGGSKCVSVGRAPDKSLRHQVLASNAARTGGPAPLDTVAHRIWPANSQGRPPRGQPGGAGSKLYAPMTVAS